MMISQKLAVMLLNIAQIKKESKEPDNIHSTENFQTDQTSLFIFTTTVSASIIQRYAHFLQFHFNPILLCFSNLIKILLSNIAF